MRTFVKLKEMLLVHKDIALKLQELEHKLEKYDGEIQTIFEMIRRLLSFEEKPRRIIGFHP